MNRNSTPKGLACESAGCPIKRHPATWTWSNRSGWSMRVCDKVRERLRKEGLPDGEFARLEADQLSAPSKAAKRA